MAYIEWKDEYATGIDVIDNQHKRIVDYINQINKAQADKNRALMTEVLINLMDYTMSHFAFEESLMEDAGYSAASIHKRTHDAFRNKIEDCKQRFDAGDDVCKDLVELLNTWLVNHIAEDDNSYVPYVKKNMPGINLMEQDSWLTQKVRQYFN